MSAERGGWLDFFIRDHTSLADAAGVQVAVGSQEPAFTVGATVLHTGADRQLWDHRHHRDVTTGAAEGSIAHA